MQHAVARRFTNQPWLLFTTALLLSLLLCSCRFHVQAYSGNLVDYHLILDLLPSLARLYLSGQLPATLSYGQVRRGRAGSMGA